MKNSGIAIAFYGILVCVGGVIGYLTAHSIASLAMGLLFGVALLGCSAGMLKNKIVAYYACMGLTTTLSAFFIYRFLHTLKVMPAGLMAVISLAILSGLLVRFFSINKQTERM